MKEDFSYSIVEGIGLFIELKSTNLHQANASEPQLKTILTLIYHFEASQTFQIKFIQELIFMKVILKRRTKN